MVSQQKTFFQGGIVVDAEERGGLSWGIRSSAYSDFGVRWVSLETKMSVVLIEAGK